ncbi:MAG: hypothetical protein AAF942_10425 [Pseudomonadota bacterium]
MTGISLHPYWIEFDLSIDDDPPFGFLLGCGVTAFTQDDALAIVRDLAFGGTNLPRITKLIEDVDVRTLDEGHVRPNMGTVSIRGIWFPLGYENPYAKI